MSEPDHTRPLPAASQVEQVSKKDERSGFFVFVVESPSPPDVYHGRSEGALLSQAAALDSIPCVTKTAINRDAFIAALRFGLSDAMQTYSRRFPILHVSAHGSIEGIQLSSGEVMSWGELRSLILPINESLEGWLVLCMSACKGYSACQMAMRHEHEPLPYYAVIANIESPSWSDTAVAYAVFYHLMAKGANVEVAVDAMRHATQDGNWTSELAASSQKSFMEYVAGVNLPAAQESLREATAAAAPDIPPDAKALQEGTSAT